jgi:hypothetical protein
MTRIDATSARLRLSVYGAVALGAGGLLMPWAMVAVESAAAAFLVAGLGDTRSTTFTRTSWVALAAIGPLLARAIDAPVLGSVVAALAVLWVRRTLDRAPYANAVLLIAALRLAFTTAAGWHCETGLAAAQSSAASVLAGHRIDLGPTYAASRVVILEVLLLLCAAPCRPLRRPGSILAGAIGAPLAIGLAAGSLKAFGSGSPDHGTRLLATQLPWAATAVVCTSAFAASRFSTLTPVRSRVILAVTLLVTTSAVALAALGTGPRETRSVLLYEPGFQNWLAPSEKEFGRYSAGMLGTLPRFVEALGAEPRMTRDLAAEEITSADAIVLINQDAPLPSGTVDRLDAFVRAGGYLVVVADHTFLHERRGGKPQLFANEPLRFTHMRFANDSADPLAPGFSASVRACRLGGSLRPGAGNPSGTSIGGAVHTSWPARPVLVATYAYEDLGLAAHDAQRGFLGDLVWNRGERLGDVVLAAEEDMGKGRVLVVGDTTGVTNLGRPFHWHWWGASLRPAAGAPGRTYACAVLLLASAVFVIAGRPRAAMIGFALALGSMAGRDHEARPLAGEAPVLVLDQAPCPEGRAGGWDGDGSLSLLLSAYRAGYVPCVGDAREGALLDRVEALVVAAPRADPGREWAERILAWVETGGRLFVGASHADSRNIAGLLAPLGAEVSPRILGPRRMILAGATVTLREPWALDVARGSWRPLLCADGEVLAAARDVGRGEVVLVGDSRFFRNEALESAERVDEENVRYLVGLLRRDEP